MAFTFSKCTSTLCRSLLLRARVPSATSTASIISLAMKEPNIQKPKPWPHEKRGYNLLHWYLEGTLKRFDENSKIIVVEGNIGAGKTAFAKQIAETFGMKYIPEPDMESIYITPYGYDLRLLDEYVPPSFRSIYIDKFYKNPYDRNVTGMQFRMLVMRYDAYIDALAHLLNTGQGLVMERSMHSDFVFLEAMTRAGYIRKAARDYYFEVYESVIEYPLKPHLIIYLDIEPQTALQRIKERNREPEVSSSVLTEKYLTDIEFFYKQRYLKEMQNHCDILVYDWNSFGDVEVVIEDIEKIDFDRFTRYDSQLKDWRYKDDWELGWIRREVTNRKDRLLRYSYVIRPEITEVYHPAHECHHYSDIMEKVPGTKYDKGFNPSLGDKVLFKTKVLKPTIGDGFRKDNVTHH